LNDNGEVGWDQPKEEGSKEGDRRERHDAEEDLA
jgi:hypothetical protein